MPVRRTKAGRAERATIGDLLDAAPQASGNRPRDLVTLDGYWTVAALPLQRCEGGSDEALSFPI